MRKWIMGIFASGLVLTGVFLFSTPALAWTYQVKSGDSLYLISQHYGADIEQLKKDNRLDSSLILADSQLWIPDNQGTQSSTETSDQNAVHLLACLINGEARGESYTGQVAVGAVIMNRMESGKFPGTIAGNVYKDGQFESVSNGQIDQPLSASVVAAAKAAISGQDPTGGALYFYNPAKIHSKTSWVWSRPIVTQIGQHVFAD